MLLAAFYVSTSAVAAGLLTGCFGGPRQGTVWNTCEGDGCTASHEDPSGESESGTLDRDVTIVTAADFEVLRDVRVLRGALVIRPGVAAKGSVDPLLQHLDALASLEEVGSLEIRDDPALVSLRGLAKLKVVHGDATIVQCPALADTNSLAALREVEGTLRVGEPDLRPDAKTAEPISLVSLEHLWLPALERVGGLAIEGNDALKTIELPALVGVLETGLSVRFDPALTDLSASFPELRQLQGSSAIGGGQKIVTARQKDEQGRYQTVEVSRTPLYGNDALKVVSWPKLESFDGLLVGANKVLAKVEAPNATIGTDLSLAGASNLQTASFSSLTQLTSFGITATPRLDRLYVPKLAKLIRSLVLSEVGSFRDLSMFSSLVEVRVQLQLFNNVNLASLAGLEKLTGIEQVDLEYNDALTDLNGLAGLTRVLGTLQLTGNGLKSVSLPKLVQADAVRIADEASLATLSLPALGTLTGVLSVERCDLLAAMAFPKLASVGAMTLAAGAARVDDAHFEALRDVGATLDVQDTLGSLGALAALERVGGDLKVRSAYVSDASAKAFVAQVQGRRKVGGTVDVTGSAP